MNNHKFFLAISTLLLSSCTTIAQSHPNACTSFLDKVLKEADSTNTKFDLEVDYGIENGSFDQAYDAMRSMESNCSPGAIAPTSPSDIKSPWNAPAYIDVSAGSHNGTAWVQFVYPSVDESYGPGLSSSITFYDESGSPVSTTHVSSYHSWEETRVSRSRMTTSGLEICAQTITPYSYTTSGDIDRELDEPWRSTCEVSHVDLSEKDGTGATGK